MATCWAWNWRRNFRSATWRSPGSAGAARRCWVCGRWAGTPQRLGLHIALRVDLPDLLKAPAALRAAGVTPLDFAGNPTEEPGVLAWMPAGSLYFRDPDGNLIEFLVMLPDAPQPQLGVIGWTAWCRHGGARW